MDKINIAQIGVGYWGPNLLRNLFNNKRCTVTHVVDMSNQRCDYVKSYYPRINVYKDVDKVLNNSNIDAVVIATPVKSHFSLSISALNQGKHILVEKPMATSVREIDEVSELAIKRHLVVMSGHTFLYNPAVRYVKQVIESGDMGEIRYIYSQRLNLGRIRSDVDALWNLAPHDISIIQFWLGDSSPISVTRSGMAYLQDNIDDVVFLNVVYPSHILANIHVSWLDPYKVRRMTIVGSEKMIVYDDVAEYKVSIFDKGIEVFSALGEEMDFDRPQFPNFTYRKGSVYSPDINFEEPLKIEIDHFIDCIYNGIECISGLKHTKEVVRILELGSSNDKFE